MTLPEIAIKRPVTMLMVLVSLFVLGGVALVRLPLAFLPDYVEPQLFVVAPYPGASPKQVERTIVRPLEEALGTLSGLREMRSWCSGDMGRVSLEFEHWRDVRAAHIEVRERIDRARGELPDDVGDITISGSWDSGEAERPILEARVASTRDLSESYDLIERKIVRPLERIPGVAQVGLDGVNPKEVRINLRPRDVAAHGLDVRDALSVLLDNNQDLSLGHVGDEEQTFALRAIGTFRSVEEIGALPIREDGLRLSDIADVRYEEPPLEHARHLDGEFAVGLTISQEANANTVAICDEVSRRVRAMGDDPELQGVNLLVWSDQGAEIRNTLESLFASGVFGAALASIVLFAFLRRVTSTAVAVASIPFSLIVACGVLWSQGRTLNTITLLGLIVGIGMLVDNAVVVMENIFRHQERGLDRATAARLGSREVSTAVIAATLTSVIAFVPMLFNRPSEMSVILRELAITVGVTLLASLFVSQTLIPLAIAHLPAGSRPRRGWRTRAMERGYSRILAFSLRRRWVGVALGLAVTASGIFPALRVDLNMDTNEAEMFVTVRYDFSEELSLDRKEQVVSRVENALDPHREEMSAKSIYSFWSENFAITRVYLEDGSVNEREIARVRAALRPLLPELPGVRLEVMDSGPFWRRDRGKRVAFQIYGEDSDVIADLAEKAKDRLREIDGLVEPFSSAEGGSDELHVELDRERALAFGIPFRQPSDVVGLTFRGRSLPKYRGDGNEREMRLLLDERETATLSQLENLPLENRDGETIPLASIATFEVRSGPSRVMREDRLTSVWVGARYDEGTRRDYLPQVEAALATLEFPDGYGWTMSRTDERKRRQSTEFVTNLSLALLLIFAVMASLFESVRQAVGLMVSLPFAISGAAWTLYLTGTDFDQPAAVGLLVLIGVVVNNGIVMLEHVNTYRRAGRSRTHAIMRGGRERLRPILMTTLTTLISLTPIVVQRPALAGVYYYSMALVIMGGLLVSTVLTLFVLPTSTILAEDIPAGLARLIGGVFRRGLRRPIPEAGAR